MKKLTLILLSLSLFPQMSFAIEGSPARDVAYEHDPFVGVGLAVGFPTGPVVRLQLSPENAIHGGVTFLDGEVGLVADYVWKFPNSTIFSEDYRGDFNPYVGGGLMLGKGLGFGYYDRTGVYDVGFGVRVPVGLEWDPRGKPFGVFFELAPGVVISNGTWGTFDVALGALYYF